ncbi:MAG: GTPase family protein [Planctomycetaceae bacterium]
MSRWRIYIILFLLLTPVLVFVGIGAWSIWETKRLLWMWVALPAAWVIAFLLAKVWGGKLIRVEEPEAPANLHWTPRDLDAWKIVEARIEAVDDIDPERMATLHFYLELAESLSHDIARVYHPKATDPIGSLTIPEILAAGQLALEDLDDVYGQYVPAGHLLTVDNFKSLAKLPKRYKLASNALNIAAAFINPVAAAGRYAATKTVLSPISKMVESNLLVWFYTAFLQRVGFYVIEMNSGRLKGGSQKFREAFKRFRANDKPWETPEDDSTEDGADVAPPVPSVGDVAPDVSEDVPPLTVCLVGQAGAGKSSVSAALFEDADSEPNGQRRNTGVRERHVVFPATGERLQLLEMAYGFGEDSGVRRKERFRAIAEADLMLLVAAANSERRDADVDFVNDMTAWFEEQPHLKPPPVVVVLTHIDLLEPALEWSPPYDWEHPTRPKDYAIQDALDRVRTVFAERIRDAVPVCSDPVDSRAFGLDEGLRSVVVTALEEAQACNSVRSLHEELGASGGIRRVWDQVRNISKALRGK